MPKIYISPSDQGRNVYAAGNTNEEAQCERIGIATEKALLRCGFDTKLNLTDSMEARVRESDEWGADVHVPLHTNAFNKKVAGTRIMCFDLKGEGYRASVAVFKHLAPITPGTSENVSAHPELYEIHKPKAISVYIEVDFHDVPDVAKWLIENTEKIAEVIAQGMCDYFKMEYIPPEGGNALYIGEGAAWSKEARAWAVGNGIIRGKGYGADGKIDFAWKDNVTREEMAVMLQRLYELVRELIVSE